jgi:S-formylglutathione hydrolase
MRTDWTTEAFARYLGNDREAWKNYDATELVARRSLPYAILVDQGTNDDSLPNLQPHLLERACRKAGQTLKLRMQEGYDHNYFFVSTFIDDHMRHHAAALHSGADVTR